MKKEKWIKIGAVAVGLLALVLLVLSGSWGIGLNPGLLAGKSEILFFEETPSPVLVAAKKAFPGYKIRRRP